MANAFAAYVYSPQTWSFDSLSYDSSIGFYTNAWLDADGEMPNEDESNIVNDNSCSYFYQIGKEDETGFTPNRIVMNDANGILTIEGKQKNVASNIIKSFRMNSPSPRFLNLRDSRRNRRPARFNITSIITDADDELVNIKEYLGLNEEENASISRAESFEAEEDLSQGRISPAVCITCNPDLPIGHEMRGDGEIGQCSCCGYGIHIEDEGCTVMIENNPFCWSCSEYIEGDLCHFCTRNWKTNEEFGAEMPDWWPEGTKEVVCPKCGARESEGGAYRSDPETTWPDGTPIDPDAIEADEHGWCNSCGGFELPDDFYGAEEFEAEGGAAQLSCTHKNKDGSECYDSTDLRSNGWYIGSLGRNEKVLCPKHGKEEHPDYYVGGLDGAAQLSCTHKNKDGSICWREGALSSDGWLIWESGQGEETLCPQHGEEQYPSYYGAETLGAEDVRPQRCLRRGCDTKTYNGKRCIPCSEYFSGGLKCMKPRCSGYVREAQVCDSCGDVEEMYGIDYTAEEFGAEEVDFAYYNKYLNYEKNGTPIEKDGYELSWGLASLNRKELIEEILGSFEYDYLLENNMVRKIDDREEEDAVMKLNFDNLFGADSVPCEDCEHYTCISIRKIMDENKEKKGAETFKGEEDSCYVCGEEVSYGRDTGQCDACSKVFHYPSCDKGAGHSDDPMSHYCSPCSSKNVKWGAEEFEAKDENKMLEILQLLQVVESKATGSNAAYAKTYAKQALMSYYQYGMKGLKTQVAYTLSNLSGWRGEEAKSVKAQLKKLIR